MAPNGNRHLNYIEKHLIGEIVSTLDGETFDRYEVEHSGGLDGFMSALYTIKLATQTKDGPKERLLIAKFMKGEVEFRESSKSYIQFANEVFIYTRVLPTFRALLQDAKVADVRADDWVAPCYVARFGFVEGLSASPTERECVLVLENVKSRGYALGPRLFLPRDHLLQMAQTLGQYHACTYVLRLRQDPRLEELKRQIVPLPFCNDSDPNDDKTNLYKALYRVAFDRFYDYFDRTGGNFDRTVDGDAFDKGSESRLRENLRRMRENFFAQPTHLLEQVRTGVELDERDSRFAAILHGDFNRNNVLFRYTEASQSVEDVKMIDFQELRYGTPAIDLSFFMYMNTGAEIRDQVWMEVLATYHASMFATLERVLKAGVSDAAPLAAIDRQLAAYNFDQFYGHFSKFAYYGMLVCMHFLPWVLCSGRECERLSHLFETDMHGEEFRQLSIDAGGDAANEVILDVIRHASRMGYMDHI